MTTPSRDRHKLKPSLKVNVDLPYDGSVVKKLLNGGELVDLSSSHRLHFRLQNEYELDFSKRYFSYQPEMSLMRLDLLAEEAIIKLQDLYDELLSKYQRTSATTCVAPNPNFEIVKITVQHQEKGDVIEVSFDMNETELTTLNDLKTIVIIIFMDIIYHWSW